jgi:hypothetical protein
MNDSLPDSEIIRQELTKLLPKPEDLREIPACVPFTAAEFEKIRAGHRPEGMDSRWFLQSDGLDLLIFRDHIDCVRFFWKARFAPRGDGFVLRRILTLKTRTEGLMFADDTAQVLYPWYLIETLLFGRDLDDADMRWPVERLLQEPEDAGIGKLLELRESLYDWMKTRVSERVRAAEAEATENLRGQLNDLIILVNGDIRSALLQTICQRLRRAADERRGFVHEIAIELGLLDRDTALRILSESWDAPVVELGPGILDKDSARRFMDLTYAKKRLILPIYPDPEERTLSLAMAAPWDMFTMDDIVLRSDREVRPYLALPSEILFWLDKVFEEEDVCKENTLCCKC